MDGNATVIVDVQMESVIVIKIVSAIADVVYRGEAVWLDNMVEG